MAAQLSAIVAAADNLAEATASYIKINTTQLEAVLPKNTLMTPWGTPIDVTVDSVKSLEFKFKIPPGLCSLITSKLSTNEHWLLGGYNRNFPQECAKKPNELTLYYDKIGSKVT